MFKRKLVRSGKVVSDKMDKTVVVELERKFSHPLYKKMVRSHKKVHVHDEKNVCKAGDVVMIKESRPLSRTKRWMLEKVVQERK